MPKKVTYRLSRYALPLHSQWILCKFSPSQICKLMKGETHTQNCNCHLCAIWVDARCQISPKLRKKIQNAFFTSGSTWDMKCIQSKLSLKLGNVAHIVHSPEKKVRKVSRVLLFLPMLLTLLTGPRKNRADFQVLLTLPTLLTAPGKKKRF